MTVAYVVDGCFFFHMYPNESTLPDLKIFKEKAVSWVADLLDCGKLQSIYVQAIKQEHSFYSLATSLPM